MSKTYDTKCLDLAKHFIPDESKDIQSQLAEYIQMAIEGWTSDLPPPNRKNAEPRDG